MHRTSARVALGMASLSIAACSTMFPKQDPQPAPISEISVTGEATSPDKQEPARSVAKQDLPKEVVPDQVLAGLSTGQVGYYMDIQEAKFRQLLGDSDINVIRAGDTIKSSMPVRISFAPDSALLFPTIEPLLTSISSVLMEFDKTLVSVQSHTDNLGAEFQNRQLSEQRSNTLVRYLLNDGISSQRLAAIGYGETRPIASNNTEHGRVLNQRIELVLHPIPL